VLDDGLDLAARRRLRKSGHIAQFAPELPRSLHFLEPIRNGLCIVIRPSIKDICRRPGARREKADIRNGRREIGFEDHTAMIGHE